MDTWHYTSEEITLDDLAHPDRLNDLGGLGFELITIEKIKTNPLRWIAVFKKKDEE